MPVFFRTFLVLSTAAVVFGAKSNARSNVVTLTKFNFEDNVKHGVWFVKFYVPGCAVCQRLAPIWEQVADHAIKQNWPVKVGQVDCNANKEACEKSRIKGVPTIGLVDKGSFKGKYSKEEVSVDSLEEWLRSKGVIGDDAESSSEEPESHEPVEEVSTSNKGVTVTFFQAARASVQNVFFKFPTESPIANLYIWAAGFLCVVAIVTIKCSDHFSELDADKDE